MDSNANQRKRGGRTSKNANANEKSQLQNVDNDEDIQVAAIAISPTLEESETATNAPAAECRRSSRKKIIKFDVRDLLNKNRKTHKIQIEARIDSNAPTTSKAASTSSAQAANSQTSLTAREDLLSKQKTFLEKSAIFRRYSISQEHKPPPPLPIPPLLGKTNDSKEVGLSGNSSSRRLSRTQEFFSNVMIKPKQTTSLIVAQIESNTPCSVVAAKRKNLCKPAELTKVNTTAESSSPPAVQQKKRGRPAKTKTQISVETLKATTVQEEAAKKAITPEKAKNWKEYKACLAQQSGSSCEEKKISKINDKAIISSQDQKDPACILIEKQEEKIVDDALQSDISRSDDDGNFSGFQTSKEDISCDSPVLGEDVCAIQSLNSSQLGNNNKNIEAKNNDTTKVFETQIFKDSNEKEPTRLNKTDHIIDTTLKDIDSNKCEKICSTVPPKNPSGKKQTHDILCKEDLKETMTDRKDFANVKTELSNEIKNQGATANKTSELNVSNEVKIQEEIQFQTTERELSNEIKIQRDIANKTSDTKMLDLSADDDVKKKALVLSNDPSEFSQNEKPDNESDVNTKIGETIVHHNISEVAAECPEVQKAFASSDKIETEGFDIINSKQTITNKITALGNEDNSNSRTDSMKIENYEAKIYSPKLQKDFIKASLETDKQFEETKLQEAPKISKNIATVHETQSESKSTKIMEESTPHTTITTNDILLLTNKTSQTQPSTPSEETKSSLSRTSSSSESENAFERSSYSSEPFSTTSSSSQRSFKSNSNLKVSVKRISLPKSPSTSSQTSTSEELNNSAVLKRKPPMAKRSKRLQKKLEETFRNENVNNDCLQRIPNDESKEQSNLNEQISVAQSELCKAENEKEICAANIKEGKSPELAEKVKPIMQETTQDSYESCTATETIDSASNESSNVENLSGKDKIVKRKSLRTRRSHDKDTQSYKSKEKEKQTEQENDRKEQSLFNISDIKQQILLSHGSETVKQEEQIIGHVQEKPINITQQKLHSNSSEEDKQKEIILGNAEEQQTIEINLKPEKPSGSEQSNEPIDSQRSKFKKGQAAKQVKKPSTVIEEQKLVAEDKTKILMACEKTKLQTESIATDKAEEEGILENKIEIKLSNLNETINNDQEVVACESSADRTKSEITTKASTAISSTNKEDISTEVLDIQAKINTDLQIKDTTLKKLSTQLSPENNDGDEIGPMSKKIEVKTIEIAIDQKKTSSPSRKSNKADKEKAIKTASARSKEIVTIKAKAQDEKLSVDEKEKHQIENASKNKTGEINESIQLETFESTRREIKSPNRSPSGTVKKSSTKNTDFKFQNKELNDDELEKAEFQQDDVVQITKIKSHAEDKSICEVVKSSQVKIKSSNEKLVAAKKETNAEKEDNNTIALTDDKIIKEKYLTKENKNQEKQLIVDEKDATLNKVSRKQKKETTRLKVLDVESCDKTKIEASDQNTTTTHKDREAGQTRKVIKTTTIKGRKDKEEVASKDSGEQVECLTQHEAGTKDKFKKVEMTERSQLSAAKTKEEHVPKESKIPENKPHDKLLKDTLENKEIKSSTKKLKESETETETEAKTHRNKSLLAADKDLPLNKKESNVIKSNKNKVRTSPTALKSTSQTDADLTKSNEINSSGLTTKTTKEMLIANSKAFLAINLEDETLKTDLNTSAKSSTKLLSLKKNIPSQHEESSKPFPESSLAPESLDTNKDSETVTLIEETFTTNTHQEDSSQDNREQTSVTPVLTKRRGKKSRFKNLHGPEVDSETDNNGKTTPVDEVTLKKLKIETKTTQQEQEQAEDKEIQNQKTCFETNSNVCEIKEQLEDANIAEQPVSSQEQSQANLSSSQIKNVSIETNTLLDILRRVQSNTEAALKNSKSPTNIEKNDNECVNESTTKVQVEPTADLLKIQQESKPATPTRLDAQSPLTAKITNLSPARSDTSSPLTLRKVTSSPTRSESLSPLTLKKVTRRYERRSRRGEDAAHKTLEETFAEIAAQSSKAVLAAKEFDTNEQHTTDEKSPKELADVNIEQDIEKEQIKENFEDFEKSTQPEPEKDESLENVLLDVDKTAEVAKQEEEEEVEIQATDNVVEVETTKATPAKRGRKPKNRALETAVTEAKEKMEVTDSLKIETDTKEVAQDIKIETDDVAEKETMNEICTNKSEKINESPESIKTGDLSEAEISLPLVSEIQVDTKENPESSQTSTVISLNPAENMIESKSSKKSNKKRDTKSVAEEDTLLSNVAVICKNKEEEEVQSPKQAMKKRDSSLSKNETKSVGKKQSKKTKNEEEESLNLQKEENVSKTAATTTPPPSKRGRKPKNQQPDTPQNTTSSKKKNPKKDSSTKNEEEEEDINVEKEQLLGPESECLNTSLDKSLDEKLAKKKRQKKLKEAFEAALIGDLEKTAFAMRTETSSPTSNSSLGVTLFNNSPPPEKNQSTCNEDIKEAIKLTCITPVETEEDPDPLKDIEKFIADGVNLLKKDYKLDEDSVDDVIQSTPKTTQLIEEPVKNSTEESKIIFNTFETPADTPLNTPSATPPPKSPTSMELSVASDENSGVRRSHRIKLITKTPKALVGRGLVRDKERFSIKDDVETKSHYTLDDHLTDLAEVEAKNAKFLKEMEERLSNFQVIKENDYLCERVISREARKMICDCFLTHEEEERGELGCGEDCLNRLLMIECGPECNVKERCTNKRFQKLLCSPCRVFRTEKKGFGIMADIEILPGEFIMEYVGEVIDTDEFEKRRVTYSQDKNRHYYFMALRSDAIIDATIKGNISRFINHSCDPNAETQKWTVNGELRIGFFSRKSIMPGEEITFNYQYQRYGREAQRCYCESSNCRGWIGQEPTSDEGEQMDDDDEDDESEDEEEETDTSNLLVHDDDEESDASVTDPEEVQKQLEMAAAQAEVELAPLQLLDEKAKQAEIAANEGKSIQDLNKSDNEEDSKSKFKKLLSKMAEKVAAKQKQNKRQQKLQRKKKSKGSSSELANKLRFLEDPDIEDEVEFLKECGLKNQSDTLRLSRLMVRAKLVQTRLNLLEILRKGDFPCRRLFLDYHGLRLLHGWMSEDAGNMQIRLALLQTLETLPIPNKTVLTDSKVMQVVRNWCGTSTNLSPNEDSSSSNSNSQDAPVQGTASFEEDSAMAELQKLALKLMTTWEGLPEIFRIPKKERIEQMKEHEREADRQYAANAEAQKNTTATDRYRRDRFGRGLNASNNAPSTSNRFVKPNNGNPLRSTNTTPESNKNLSKAQRREMFAAKVARDEAEKRLAEERREFETKCRFFGLDPKKTRTQDIPFCVNPATGQWFSIERKPITTPPSYAHVQVPVKPKSTDPNDYQLPAVCSSLPPQWKYAITPQGKIYYYHVKHRIPQWEPPSAAQLQQCELEAREEDSESELTTTAGEDSSDDDDDVLVGMDAAQLKAYIDRKVEIRRQKRYQRLVDERSISPRREEDRIYNQIEVRKYKENKEKIRKRKEDIRRKRAEALRQTSLNMCTLGSITETNPNSNTPKSNAENDEEVGALPIQDYLLSSDEEIDLKAEVNNPLIDKIVEGDKIVDELDALTTKRQLKRPLPPHRDLYEHSTSSSSASTSASVLSTISAKQEYKKRKLEKKEKRKPKEQDAKYRKTKEKFRCEIAGIIVHHLKPYLKENCIAGRIQSNEDFNHLARKLTHFVMIKELKYCESVGQTLVVTESVKSKSREFIKKYMAKYGDVYVKPTNDPDFKDIPFTL